MGILEGIQAFNSAYSATRTVGEAVEQVGLSLKDYKDANGNTLRGEELKKAKEKDQVRLHIKYGDKKWLDSYYGRKKAEAGIAYTQAATQGQKLGNQISQKELENWDEKNKLSQEQNRVNIAAAQAATQGQQLRNKISQDKVANLGEDRRLNKEKEEAIIANIKAATNASEFKIKQDERTKAIADTFNHIANNLGDFKSLRDSYDKSGLKELGVSYDQFESYAKEVTHIGTLWRGAINSGSLIDTVKIANLFIGKTGNHIALIENKDGSVEINYGNPDYPQSIINYHFYNQDEALDWVARKFTHDRVAKIVAEVQERERITENFREAVEEIEIKFADDPKTARDAVEALGNLYKNAYGFVPVLGSNVNQQEKDSSGTPRPTDTNNVINGLGSGLYTGDITDQKNKDQKTVDTFIQKEKNKGKSSYMDYPMW